MAEESSKSTEDPGFKGGVMSPNSKRTFSEMRHAPPPLPPKQKIILDEETFEDSFLRCVVCRERYNMTDRAPKMFPCHHAFCMSCILLFYDREAEYRQSLAPMAVTGSDMAVAVSIACPTCGHNFITTAEGLKQLTSDHRIVQLMDFVGNTDKQTINFCPSHALQPLNFFCEKCVQPICRDCTVLDHKDCSKTEGVIDLGSATDKYVPVLERGIENMTREANALAEKKTECEKALENCQQDDDPLTKSIKESFDKLRKALNDREHELLDMVTGSPVKRKEMAEEKLNKILDKEKEVAEIVEAIKKAKSDGSVQELFTAYKKLDKYETEPPMPKEEAESSEQPTSTFNRRDEQLILNRIKNFGEIQSQSQTNGYSSSSSYSYSAPLTYGSSSRYSTYTPSYTSRYAPRTTYKY